MAIDGKAQRGRLRFAAAGCPVHALSAFCHEQGIVLAHEPIVAGIDKAWLGLSKIHMARYDYDQAKVSLSRRYLRSSGETRSCFGALAGAASALGLLTAVGVGVVALRRRS